MSPDKRPPLLISTLAVIAVMVFWAMLRLGYLSEKLFPLTFVLPLMLCVWTRRMWHLWFMVVAAICIASYKRYWQYPLDPLLREQWESNYLSSNTGTIIGAAVVLLILRLRDRLDAHAAEIERKNAELEARTEELFHQNEEMTAQAEELTRQAEEIENQTEELTQQNEDLQHTNALLAGREEILQAMLECTREAGDRVSALEEVCRRALSSLGAAAGGIAVLEQHEGVLRVIAQMSLPGGPVMPEEWPAGQSLGAVVLRERRTAYVDDFAQRPDLAFPFPETSGCRSALVTPLFTGGEVAGLLAVCASAPGHWSQEQFRLLEWSAAQCALLFESRRWQEALRERTIALEAASRAKDTFLASLSHELRTPLTPVLVTAGMLEEDPRLPEDVVADVRVIQRNIAVQSRLIDDLLDLTRIARGKMDLHLEPVKVKTLLGECAGIVASDLTAAGVKLEARVELPDVAVVHGDGARLQQIFWNILTNSIKFSPRDGVITMVAAAVPGESKVAVTIMDQGPGIPPEDLERIFQPFEQSASSGGRQSQRGLGLGLSIARAITELHDGIIKAWPPEKGSGAKFTVTLPLAESGAETGATVVPPPAPAAETPAKPLRILLVEDHEDTGRSLTRLLTRSGYQVRHARSRQEARDAWREDPLDMLVSDLGLADGSGIDVIQDIRALSPDVPAICMSGYGMAADIARTREAGFQTHLIKPVRFQALEEAIRNLRNPGGDKAS